MLTNAELDQRLCDVPLPAGLVDRIRADLHDVDDFALEVREESRVDRVVAAVSVRRGLLESLKEIPANEMLTDQLLDVEVPWTLAVETQMPTLSERWPRWVDQVWISSLAAILFMIFSAGLAMLVEVTVGPHFAALHEDDAVFVVAYHGPMTMEAAAELEADSVFTSTVEMDFESTDELPGYESAEPEWLATLGLEAWPLDHRGMPPFIQVREIKSPAMVRRDLFAKSPGLESWLESLLGPRAAFRDDYFGSPELIRESLPELEWPASIRGSGWQPPRSAEYPQAFLSRFGVHPWTPVRTPELAWLSVPLSARTQSFDQTCRSANDVGQLPPRDAIHTEDFIAAIGMEFPRPAAGQVALHTAAGHSLFGHEGTSLLQVAAQAGNSLRARDSRLHTVLAIDCSAEMARADRWATVIAALRRWSRELQSEHRATIVVFREQVVDWFRELTAAELATAISQLEGRRPQGAANLPRAIQVALSEAMTGHDRIEKSRRPSRVVLVTCNRPLLSTKSAARVENLCELAASANIPIDSVDMSGSSKLDVVFSRWSTVAGGTANLARSPTELFWCLESVRLGSDATLARDVSISVHWNPALVASYRLIGHERSAAAWLRPTSTSVNLRPGECLTSLLEFQMSPPMPAKNSAPSGSAKGPSSSSPGSTPGPNRTIAFAVEEIAKVELVWTDLHSGKIQIVRRTVRKADVSPDWSRNAAHLQQATIAAEAAEVLRGSRQALREQGVVPVGQRSLADVVSWSRQVSEPTSRLPRYREFVRQIEQWQSLRQDE